MGFDIEGITLTSPGANSLAITNNSNTMTFNSSGRLLVPGTPVFTASGTNVEWEYKASAGWYTVTYNSILNNVGSCMNTNGRFTAPITGRYLFTFSAYSYMAAASIAEYMHPLFLVNASYTSRRGGGSTAYRLRGHGYADAYKDMEMTEILALQASDYVEAYIYHQSTTCAIYGVYKLFTGVFLG
jgi:hypothetical protein